MPRRSKALSTAAPTPFVTAAWLSDQSLVGVVSLAADPAALVEAALIHDGEQTQIDVFSTPHPGQGPAERDGLMRWILLLRAETAIRGGSRFALSLTSGRSVSHIKPMELNIVVTDIRSLVRSEFTPLPAAQRAQVIEFLVGGSTSSTEFTTDQLRQSRNLNVVREMLRERLPKCELSSSRAEGLAIEALLRITDADFYVEGWSCDVESRGVRLTAVSPEGARAEVLGDLFWYDRPDVQAFFQPTVGADAAARCGFIAYFHLNAPSRLPNGWVFEMETAAGTAMEAAAPAVVTVEERIRTKLLGDMSRDASGSHKLRRLHISPALSKLQARRAMRVKVDRDVIYGDAAIAPDVSVIVPLYGRMDLMEHQVAQFATDPELHRAEIIYVVDSPERGAEVIGSAQRLFRLYRLPIRVLTLTEHAGFSIANNVAASVARGRLLVLLNSDVLPRCRGWLSAMTRAYDAFDRPGAIGPMLLYEDDSVQHAGLYFERPVGSRLWNNEHYFKGLHMDLAAANIAREVPAVTAACLMVDAHLFRDVGGLSDVYVQGDSEDSDLCLRLREAGRSNRYVPEVQLYHLEAQSYPSALRNLNREYNRWLFNELWSTEIEQLTAELETAEKIRKTPHVVMRQSNKIGSEAGLVARK
jgi:GT2 family glycosyltransferase